MFTFRKKIEPSWILSERREYLLDTVKYLLETYLQKSRRCQLEEVQEEDVHARKVEVEPSPKIVASEDHDALEPREPLTMDISQKRKPVWVREIVQEEEKYGALKGSTKTRKRSNPFPSYVALMCDIVDQEPTNYEEVVQKKKMGRSNDERVLVHN